MAVLDIRKCQWFSHFRHSVFGQIGSAVFEGATRVSMIQVKPRREQVFTREEFPALQQDIGTAYDNKSAPFHSKSGEAKILFSDVTWQQVDFQDLEDELRAKSTTGRCAIVCSCAEDKMEAVENLVRNLNSTLRGGEIKVKIGWATARDVYQDRVSHAAPTPAAKAAPKPKHEGEEFNGPESTNWKDKGYEPLKPGDYLMPMCTWKTAKETFCRDRTRSYAEGTEGWAEFQTKLEPGSYKVLSHYATEDSRVLKFSLNGEELATVANEITGGFRVEDMAWFVEDLTLEITEPEQTIRLEAPGFYPAISAFAFIRKCG